MLASDTTVLFGLVAVACWAMLPVAVAAMFGLFVGGAVTARWRWSIVTLLAGVDIAAVVVAASVAAQHIPF